MGKSDDSNPPFSPQIFIVVFGGRVPFRVDVQRTEGVPPFILLFLQVMDIAIDFNDQPCPMTVQVNDESLNNLLSQKMDSQLIRPPKVLEGAIHSVKSSPL